MSSTPLGPDSRISVFVTETGKVHKSASYSWGAGVACSDRFVMGTLTEALVSDIDCRHCRAHDLPDSWEIRIPDKRYKRGYRVVSSGLVSEIVAKQMVNTIKSSPNYSSSREPYAVSVAPDLSEDE